MKFNFTAVKSFFQRLFPKLFKQPVSKPVEAPTINAPVAVATPVAKPAEVVPAAVVVALAPTPGFPPPVVPGGPLINTATLSLTGPITGNGGVAGGPQPGPIAPVAPSQSLVLDQPGVVHSLPTGTTTFIVPVRQGQKAIVTTAEFSDPVQGTLYDSASNPIETHQDNQGHLYFYFDGSRSDDFRLVVSTDSTNPQAHIERQGDV